MINTVIVEDEILIAKYLENIIIEHFPNLHVQTILTNVKDCIKFFSENTVDLIFMDIFLEDSNCFKIFEQIEINTPIVFTTTFDEYAIKAFDQNSIAYLIKPITVEKLQPVIKKYMKNNMLNNGQYKNLFKDLNKSRIKIVNNGQFTFINKSDIAYLKAENKECLCIMKDKKEYKIFDYSLNSIMQELNPLQFFRISRSCIVNKDIVTRVHKQFLGKLKLETDIKFDDELYTSRDNSQKFLDFMEL